jgi:hypothetical protein
MRIRPILHFVLGMFILSCTQAFARPMLQTGKAISDLGDCIDNAKSKFNTGEASTLLNQIETDYSFIKTRWRETGSKDLPADYLLTLNHDCMLLSQALQEADPAKVLEILQSIARDLRLKARAASPSSPNAAEALGSTFRVTVRTFRNGQEVSGYTVRCNPRLYKNSNSSLFAFNRQTSPATRTLPPGYFELKIEDNSGNIVKTRSLTLGEGDGVGPAVEIPIDLP